MTSHIKLDFAGLYKRPSLAAMQKKKNLAPFGFQGFKPDNLQLVQLRDGCHYLHRFTKEVVFIFFLSPRKIPHAVKSLLGLAWQGARSVHVAYTYGRGLQGRAANPNTVKYGSCPGLLTAGTIHTWIY